MIHKLRTDAYGDMLWDLKSNPAEEYFKCWNTGVKLVYGVPRSTYTYLVEGFLAKGQPSLRNQVLSRYSGFYRKLLNSPSKEVRMLVRMVSTDPRFTTCKILKYLREKTGFEKTEIYSSWRVMDALPVQTVPTNQMWTPGLLSKLMNMKHNKFIEVQDNKRITAMIDRICST